VSDLGRGFCSTFALGLGWALGDTPRGAPPLRAGLGVPDGEGKADGEKGGGATSKFVVFV